jgi:hypothetical protein
VALEAVGREDWPDVAIEVEFVRFGALDWLEVQPDHSAGDDQPG